MNRIRAAWLTGGSVFAVGALAVGGYQVAALLGRTVEHATTTVAGPIRHLVVDADAGAVRVLPGTGSGVVVDRRIVRSLTAPTFTSSVAGDRLTLHTSCPALADTFCEESLTIHAPAAVDITATAGGGGIRVDGFDGALHLRSSGGGVRVAGGNSPIVDAGSSGGGITVEGGGGRLELHSSGRGITVEGTHATVVSAASSGGGVRVDFAVEPVDVDVSSSGGGVTVTVPAGPASYNVDASSSGGGTHVDVRTDPNGGDHRIDARSSGGGVNVRYRDAA